VKKILSICGKSRRRSSLAEEIFAGMDGIEVSSAGISAESECPVSADLLEWADRVDVMERSQRRWLRSQFAQLLKDKRVVCLNIPDVYLSTDLMSTVMQSELVVVLQAKVFPLLRRSGT
jgi:predicted protein tyrosine phosphatase